MATSRILLTTPWSLRGLAIDPAQRRLYVATERYHIWGVDSVDLVSGVSRPVSAIWERSPAVTPDGAALLVIVQFPLASPPHRIGAGLVMGLDQADDPSVG